MSSSAGPASEKIKLLVVDDEPGVLDMVRQHFTPRGYEVETAEDGTDAIEVCARQKPQVILLDLKMKRMDGNQALPHLKKIVPDAKVFVISAYQDEILERKIAGLGAYAHFEKPISIVALEKAVRASVSR